VTSRRKTRWGTDERGSASVEFALVLPVLFLMLFALVEVAVVARTQLEIMHAARVGAREAAAAPDPARAVRASLEALGPALAPRARVAVRRPSIVGAPAEVTIRLPYRAFSPLLGGLKLELRARSVMRVER
jgi:hypothetical protein